MRNYLEEVRETLAEFCEQPYWSALILQGDDAAIGMLMNSLENVEASNQLDTFFCFTHALTSAEHWSVRAFTFLKLNIERTNRLPMPADPPPLPLPPSEARDQSLSLAERWRIGFDYFRTLINSEEDERLIVAAVPTSVESVLQYEQVIACMVPLVKERPYVRLIVRDVRGVEGPDSLLDRLRAMGVTALSYRVDLSAAAMMEQTVAAVESPETPLLERMIGMLQLGFMDYAHHRNDAALEKFGRICAFCVMEQNAVLHASALYGAGMVQQRTNDDPGEAVRSFQRGIALAIEANAHPLLLELLFAIVPASMDQGDYESARSYADSAHTLSKNLAQRERAILALVARGEAELEMRLLHEARTTWEEADRLAEEINDYHGRREALERLLSLFESAEMVGEAHVVRHHLNALPPAEEAHS